MNEPTSASGLAKVAASEPTNAEVIANITAAVGALQDAQAQAVQAVATLTVHETSATAHGIDDVASPFRKTVAAVVKTATADEISAQIADAASALSVAMSDKADKAATKAVNTQLSNPDSSLNAAIASKAASAVNTNITEQLANPKSVLSTAISTSADTAIKDAVASGGIGGGGNGTITVPAITGSDSAPIGYAISYGVSASSGLQNGAITSFRYKLGSAPESTVSASNNAATLPVTVPSGTAVGAKLTLTVIAVDNYGNERSATKEITAIAASITAPTITSPALGTVVSPVSIPLTASAFAVTGSTDTHAASKWKITSDTAGTDILWQSGRDTSNKTSITATIPPGTLAPGSEPYVFASYEGTALGQSPWSAGLKLKVATVNAPVITSPAANTAVSHNNITLVTSGFSCPGGVTDTHASTDWKITSDAAGNTVVASALGSSDKTSHVFVSPPVTKGSGYYLWVRYNGTACGSSTWVSVKISIKVSMHGEIIYAADGVTPDAVTIGNPDGSPLVRKDGSEYWLEVAVAAKRGVSKLWWSDSGTYNVDIPGLVNCTGGNAHMSASTTNADVNNTIYYASNETNTSKHNTDAIMAQSNAASYAQAAVFARSQTIAGVVADLPNAPSLCHIWRLRDFIDSIDPTAAANTSKKLANWGFGTSNGSYLWSSSEYNSNHAVLVASGGNMYYNYKYGHSFGVVPAREIAA